MQGDKNQTHEKKVWEIMCYFCSQIKMHTVFRMLHSGFSDNCAPGL